MDTALPAQESIAWFHELANHNCSEIARRCSTESLARLRAHLALCLTGQPVPEELTPEQFAEVVLDLRANELHWEQTWMAVVVKADDLVLAGQTEEAAHALLAFAQECPWRMFREAAQHEAGRMLGE